MPPIRRAHHSWGRSKAGRELREELSQGKQLGGEFFCRMGKLLVEEMLGAEVADALGRDKSHRLQEGQAGYRNGYKGRTLRTGEGAIELEVPQVRGLEEPYRSKTSPLFLDGRMNAEVMRVLAIQHPATDGYYTTTLFAPQEAVTGSCTGRSTIYNGPGALFTTLQDLPTIPVI